MTTYMSRFLRPNQAVLTLAMVMVLIASACSKKTPIPPPPPPAPTASAPSSPNGPSGSVRPVVAQFSVEPSTIERGQTATLTWDVSGSTNIVIDNGVGTVAGRGNQRIAPMDTTT